MKKKSLMCIIVLSLCFVVVSSVEATTYGSYVSGLWKSFETANASQTEVSNTQGIAFDTVSQSGGVYDTVYLANHSTTDTRQGVYAVDIINETAVKVALGSEDNPTDVAVASDGTLYASSDGTPYVYKVENPSSGSPTETQILSNYGDTSSDDDIGNISLVPTGFGGGYDAGSDVVLFDCGMDDNANSAVSVLDQSTGTVTTLWNDSSVNTIRGECSSYDGYAYFVNYDDPSIINRINGDGIVERIFLDIDSELLPKLDSAVAINPVDGSLWIAINDDERNIFRVDVANAVLQGGTTYLADITLEISDLGYDVPNYSMAFSPDGELLAIGWDSGVDKLYIYNIVPEPATMLFFVVGVASVLRRRRK